MSSTAKSLTGQCNQAQQQIAESLADIVAAVIKEAKENASVPHVKFLLEWAQLQPSQPESKPEKRAEAMSPAPDSKKGPEGKSIAETLLDSLDEKLAANPDNRKPS